MCAKKGATKKNSETTDKKAAPKIKAKPSKAKNEPKQQCNTTPPDSTDLARAQHGFAERNAGEFWINLVSPRDRSLTNSTRTDSLDGPPSSNDGFNGPFSVDSSSRRTRNSRERPRTRQSRSTNISQSNSGRSSSSEDFLGRPPSRTISDLYSPSEGSSLRRSQRLSNSLAAQLARQRSSTSGPTSKRKNARKHAQPKKRTNRIAKEIREYQNSTKQLIPRLPFQRLVREVLQKLRNDFRLQSTTLECLQEACENYVVQLFEDSYLCALHRSRITLAEKDIRLIQILRGPLDTGRR